jgi:hypothetical protein
VASCVRAGVEHRHDVRMLDLTRGSRLAQEPMGEDVVASKFLAEDLQGNHRLVCLPDARNTIPVAPRPSISSSR